MATVEKSTEKQRPNETPNAGEALPRDRMIAVLQDQPADSSYDDLLRAILIDRAIDRGLADADAGRVVSHEEAVERIRSWRTD